jgi:hypothetical protein
MESRNKFNFPIYIFLIALRKCSVKRDLGSLVKHGVQILASHYHPSTIDNTWHLFLPYIQFVETYHYHNKHSFSKNVNMSTTIKHDPKVEFEWSY